MQRVHLIAAGDPPPTDWVGEVKLDDVIVACDGGLAAALDFGLDVDLLVGDLDSAAPARVDAFRAAGGAVVSFLADKDRTDLELALDEVIVRYPGHELVVTGVAGGRVDHQIGNWAALAGYARRSGGAVRVWLSEETIYVVADSVSLDVSPGQLVSIHPWGGEASGVSTTGLKWPLGDATLSPFEALGVSNVSTGEAVTVAVRTGVIFVSVQRLD